MNLRGLAGVLVLSCACTAHAADRYKCDGPDGKKAVFTEEVPGGNCIKLPSFPDMTRWELVTMGESGVFVFIDKKTIVSEPGAVTAWVQYFYDDKGKTVNNRTMVRMLQREEYNCKGMTVGTTSTASYDWYGEEIQSYNNPLGGTRPVIPDTITEGLWRRLCR